MTNPDNVGGLLPCPFCGCAMQISSSRYWHRVVGDHDGDCLLFDADGTIYPATDEGKAEALATWNRRELCRAAPAGGDDGRLSNQDDYTVVDCPRCGTCVQFVRKEAQSLRPQDSAPAGSGEVEDVASELERMADDDCRGNDDEPLPAMQATLRTAAALLRKLQQGADYVMVPRVPTDEMKRAFESMVAPYMFLRTGVTLGDFDERYRAMLEASQGQEGGTNG